MQMQIYADGFELTTSMRAYAKGRFVFALDRARHAIRQVTIRLSDINGPRGGRDKRCKVQITLPEGRDVLIDDLDADMYSAIDRAADRAHHSVTQRLARRLGRRRASPLRRTLAEES